MFQLAISKSDIGGNLLETIKSVYLFLYDVVWAVSDAGTFIHVAPICLIVESYITYVCLRGESSDSAGKRKKQMKFFWTITAGKILFYFLLLSEYLKYSSFGGRPSQFILTYYVYTALVVLIYGYYLYVTYLAPKKSNSSEDDYEPGLELQEGKPEQISADAAEPRE